MSAPRHLSRHHATSGVRQRKLFLTFRLGLDRYVFAASDIVAVLALSQARPIASAPAWVSGLITYQAQPVPVIDLSARALGIPARAVTSTRIVLVNFPKREQPIAGHGSSKRLLGVMVEHVTETVHLDPRAFVPSGVNTPQARYLGPIHDDGAGYIQWVRTEDLLDAEVRACLYDAVDSELPS